MKLWLWLFPLFICSAELEVYLPTQSTLPSVSLETSSDPYGEKLLEVLGFDLKVGGHCRLTPDKSSFLVSHRIEKGEIVFSTLSSNGKERKEYPPIPLSYELAQDRRKIHAVADQIQRTLFHKEGIFTTSLLYTQRVQTSGGWTSEIWTSDFDGENKQKLLSSAGYCLSPFFFPEQFPKEGFYFVSFENGQSKIYASSLIEKRKSLLISLRGSQALPAMNFQASALAFISDTAGRPDLFLQRLDQEGNPLGKPKQLFSAPRATQASPTFSPDGKKLAFVSDKDGPPRIYVIELGKMGASVPVLLTKKNRENTSPAWSPDGKKLAYSAKVDGVRQIWIYDFATQEESPLTTGPENKENPSWAPDSFHLVYNTETEDTCQLYLAHLECQVPIQITHGTGQKRFPSWGKRMIK